MRTITTVVVVLLLFFCSCCFCLIRVAPLLRLGGSSAGLYSDFLKPTPFTGRCATHQQHGLLSLALAKHHAGESAGAAAESGSAKVDRRKIATSQRVPDMQTAMLSATSEKLQLPGELVNPSSGSTSSVKRGRKKAPESSKRGEKPLSGKLARIPGRVRSAEKGVSAHLGREDEEEGGMVPMDVLADGETDAYLDMDTLDSMLRALTGGSAEDEDVAADFDADLETALALAGAGGSALRRGRSALLDHDAASAAGAGGFEGEGGLAPGELLAGAPEGDDDSAPGEDLAELGEEPDGLLDLGIDLDDADGDLEERGAEEDEPPARKLRGRQRVVQILAASQRGADSSDADEDADSDPESFSAAEMEWLPNVYRGGRPKQSRLPASLLLLGDEYRGEPMLTKRGAGAGDSAEDSTSEVDELVAAGDVFAEQVEHKLFGHDQPSPWRVQIVSVVTNSSRNSTALDCVNRVYDFIKAGTANDPRVAFQTICLAEDEDTPFEELEDMVQMWLEGYNTYHLVDGAAMKEAWGGIMPDILLSPRNLQAILDRVLWALEEDGLDGALLTPRLRRLRFRGGAQEMSTGFNTEHLESEFSVVSVR